VGDESRQTTSNSRERFYELRRYGAIMVKRPLEKIPTGEKGPLTKSVTDNSMKGAPGNTALSCGGGFPVLSDEKTKTLAWKTTRRWSSEGQGRQHADVSNIIRGGGGLVPSRREPVGTSEGKCP